MMHRTLLGALLLAALPACNRIKGCPSGFAAVSSRSVEGKHVLCRDESGSKGLWIEFVPGTLSARQLCPIENDRLEGEFKALHVNGKDWIRGLYSNGQKTGKWVQFNDRGLRVAEGEYRGGVLTAGAPVGIAAKCESAEL